MDVLCETERGGCELSADADRSTEPRYPQLANTIVAKTAAQPEALMSAEDAMFYFFRARGHMGMRTRYFDGFQKTGSLHTRRYMAYIDVTSLMYEARELYSWLGSKAQYRDTYLTLRTLALSDFPEASASMDLAGQARIYSALTVAAVAGNRFHAAIEYASKIPLAGARLRAFSEIMAAWQAMREKIGDDKLDELADRGVGTLEEARNNVIRRNPSH